MNDDKAVALVGNGFFIGRAMRAKTCAGAAIMVMAMVWAWACAVSERFETSRIVRTADAPLRPNPGAAQFAQEEPGAKNVACIGGSFIAARPGMVSLTQVGLTQVRLTQVSLTQVGLTGIGG